MMETTALTNVEKLPARLLESLGDGELLIGDVISAYLHLLERRSILNPSLPRIRCLDTFFFPAWNRRGYQGIRRQILAENLLLKDMVLVPIHEPEAGPHGHWYLIVIEPVSKQISAYDSVPGRDHRAKLESLKRFMDEHCAKMMSPQMKWCLWGGRTCPKQNNGADCGVYLCAFADALSRGMDLKCRNLNVPAYRRKMLRQLKKGAAEQEQDFPELAPKEAGLSVRVPEVNKRREIEVNEDNWTLEDWEQLFGELAPPPLISPIASPVSEDFVVVEKEAAEEPERLPPSIFEPSSSGLSTTAADRVESRSCSPVLSLAPDFEIDSDGSSIEVISEPEDEWTVVPMEVDQAETAERATTTAQNEHGKGNVSVNLRDDDFVPVKEHQGDSVPADGPHIEVQGPKKRRRGGKRRVMRVYIPQLGCMKRINIRHLGLTPYPRERK